MAGAAFRRLTDRVLRQLGQDAILRSEVVDPPIKAHVEHGVQFAGYDGESASYRGDATFERDVLTLEKRLNPRIGDRVDLLDDDGAVEASYVLDRKVEDNGFSVRFIGRPA